MRALIVETGRRISPLGDPPGAAQYASTTVDAQRQAALEARGFETIVRAGLDDAVPGGDGPWLVLLDHCFLSDKCLGDFLSACFGDDAPSVLALCRTPSSDYLRPVSSVRIEPLDESGPGARPPKAKWAEAEARERVVYDCFYVPGALQADTVSALVETLRVEASRRVIEKKELRIEVRMPILGDRAQTTMIYPVTSTIAGHIEHWVHVLWLNHLAFGIRWNEIARAHKAWCVARLLRAGLPTRDRVMRAFVRKGRNVKIHKTAVVEASILGDNVTIGARATVRNSILGDGVEVGDHAAVLACTLGSDVYVTPKSFFVWSVAYPDAVVSNYKLQMSVLGRGAATSTWAGLIDAKFQGAIAVPKNGQMVSTERSFLGSCLGHGAYIGAKVLIHAGREIPSGVSIAMRPDELISEIPSDIEPGVAMVRDRGTLVSLASLQARAQRSKEPTIDTSAAAST